MSNYRTVAIATDTHNLALELRSEVRLYGLNELPPSVREVMKEGSGISHVYRVGLELLRLELAKSKASRSARLQ